MKTLKQITFPVLFATAAVGLSMPTTAMAAQDDNMYQIGTFEDIDVDKSGFLENGEYLDYAFGRADWDNDGYLEDTEWVKYTEVYYDPFDLDYNTYNYYDTDGDGMIDRREFNEVPTVDMFAVWDYDDDAMIDEGDWDKVTAHYYDDE